MKINCESSNERTQIRWVRGNTQPLSIPLEQEVMTENEEIRTEPYYPSESDKVTVYLVGRFKRKAFTPEIDGNVLIIHEDGTLSTGSYHVEVLIEHQDGTRNRSLWCNQVVITESNDTVLEEWDEFKQQEPQARAAIFFFAKGDKGDPFTYEDFTQEQIEDLKKPAVDAAAELTDKVHALESEFTESENQRVANENQRVANEIERVNAETSREQQSASDHTTALSDHATSVSDHTTAQSDHTTALSDHTQASSDHVTANGDHTRAESDHALAVIDHTTAESDHQTAETDHTQVTERIELADADHVQATADHATAVSDHTTATSDHTQAATDHNAATLDHNTATSDHAKASTDHTTAQSDHATATNDHDTATTDHQTAVSDHSIADGDHTLASADHTTAVADHTQADSDHTRAENDNATATSDHTTANGDHTTAAADHTQAVSDHTTAAADHTTAESDHAAVEVYVDSLGVFDLSKHNAVGGVLATYADLSAALTALTALDSKYKYGGMSFKFVQSSDNNYVQFHYKPDDAATVSKFTNVANWQGVDDEPTAGSDNLVKSGGVHSSLLDTRRELQEELNRAVESITPIEITGDVTNAPDEEDLTSINVGGTDVLKFKDKAYNPLTYSGMGRKILRKNIVNGVNTLTQSMMSAANTIYVIQYDFTLGEDITVPQNCVLEFEGGSLSNGTLVGNDTIIESFTQNIFNDVVFGGTYLGKFYISYYNAQDYSTVLNSLVRSYDTIILDKDIKINNPVIVNGDEKEKICIIGNNITIDAGNLTGSALFWFGNKENKLKNIAIKGINVDYKNNVIQSVDEQEQPTSTLGIQCNALEFTEISDVTVENYGRDEAGVDGSSFFAIQAASNKKGIVKIDNIRCMNLVVTGDGTVNVGYGACYGITVEGEIIGYDEQHNAIREFGQGYINNILCSDIKSINSQGVEILDDATGIYIKGVAADCSIPITNCKFINNTKRAIKIQANGVVISNILLSSNFAVSSTNPYNAINIQGNNSRITNVKGTYNGTIVIVQGQGNHVIENIDVDVMDSSGVFAIAAPHHMITFRHCIVRSNDADFIYIDKHVQGFGNYENYTITCDDCYFHGKNLVLLDTHSRTTEYLISFNKCHFEVKSAGSLYLGALSFTKTRIYPLDSVVFVNDGKTSFIDSEFHLDYVETHENEGSFANYFLIRSNTYINGLKVFAANHIHIDLIRDAIDENGEHIEGVEILKIDETVENHGKIRTLGGIYAASGISTFGDVIIKNVKAVSCNLAVSAKLRRVFYESLNINSVNYLDRTSGSPNFVGEYINCNPSVSGGSNIEGSLYLINNSCWNFICICNSAGNAMQYIPNTDYKSKLFHSTTRPPLTLAGAAGFQMHDDSIDKDIMWNGERWVDNLGFTAALGKGETAYRPKGIGATGGVLDPTKDIGYNYYDTTINKPIYVSAIAIDGTVTWVDATGATV